ncbi:FG-GAP-like repeat-containing protein [Maioricimonas rarisocia]|nr:FG-GAP-like repeat-containing protein [Maioricimonas rarisocia]
MLDRRLLLLLVCLIVAAGALWFTSGNGDSNASADELAAAAANRLSERDFEAAAELARAAITRQPGHPQALLVAGEVATRMQRFEEALTHYGAIPSEATEAWLTGQLGSGEILRTIGRLSRAEEAYQRASAVAPDLPLLHERLALLQRVTGRPRAARSHLRELLALGASRPEHLAWLADPFRVLSPVEYLQQCRTAAPNDPLPLQGLAAVAMSRGEFAEAAELLREVVRRKPDALEAQAALGRCLWELDARDDYAAWFSGLPESAAGHPDIWFALGLIAGQREEAAACFAECARQDVEHRSALHRFAIALLERNDEATAATAMQRAERLARLESLVAGIRPEQPNVQACVEAGHLLVELARFEEAVAWWQVAGTEPEIDRRTVDAAAEAAGVLQDLLTRSAGSKPAWQDIRGWFRGETGTTPEILASRDIRFEDEAARHGIDFTYFESPDPTTEGRRMFEFTGGGVAAFDYDRDGWPDLYFTQGANWPPEGNTAFLDRLFRNRAGGGFQQVTDGTRIAETGYSQGVATGDINNDGLADLYVANFGRNRLFVNNGDGTFDELTLPAGGRNELWTTSCLIADLNGDGLPDLYDVNYVTGDDVTSRICETSAGPRVCTPQAFPPAPDRLLINRGDGSFKDVSDEAGVPRGGRGLGIVAFDFDADGACELFVANDAMQNFLLDNTAGAGESPRFEDVALVSGLAFGADGEAQACMGVAAADFDADGVTDLFVTNYFNESNTLYLQQSPGLALDLAASRGLRAPSMPLLGFGTQAIDVDLDGEDDLVVANGDLDDFSHEGRAFRMRPQLFMNTGDGRFEELPESLRSGYFDGEVRGRGLARLDWNRDGRGDFAVSHLDEPSALATNRTATANHFLALRLVGTKSARDAIGARVTILSKDRQRTYELTAGDGYQASNERQLLIGLGAEGESVGITVYWPDGTVWAFDGLQPDTGYAIVEGATVPFRLPPVERGRARPQLTTPAASR